MSDLDFVRSSFAGMSNEQRAQVVGALSMEAQMQLAYDWNLLARENQRLPLGDWRYWLILAGRGWGKTRTGGEACREWSKTNNLVNLIASTADDARDIMIEGESGILAICPKWERPKYEPSKRKLTWPNGNVSLIFTADEPERLRGKQHSKLWCDELAAWRYPDAWDQAQFGLRLGSNPQAVITTTPKPSRIIRGIAADAHTKLTRGSTYDNKANLAAPFLGAIITKYEGTRIGRQELGGEILDDNPGALFKREDIEKGRIKEIDHLDRIVVAIDPAVSSSATSDETGIVAAGIREGHGFILRDRSLKGSPAVWARAAVDMFHELKADRIVAETNNGGEMVLSTIRTIDPNVPVTAVTATRGKALRAEPVAALYEQGRIHHVGMFADLEDQMCEWNPEDFSAHSPDRLDALVWALTNLMLSTSTTGALDYIRALTVGDSAIPNRGPSHWASQIQAR